MVNSSTGAASLQAEAHSSEQDRSHECFHESFHSPVAAIPTYLLAHGNISLRELRVIAAIATFRRWPHGSAWVVAPQSDIARIAGMDPSHVRKAIRRLRDDPDMRGVIQIRGFRERTEYRLYFPGDALAVMQKGQFGPVAVVEQGQSGPVEPESPVIEQGQSGPVEIDGQGQFGPVDGAENAENEGLTECGTLVSLIPEYTNYDSGTSTLLAETSGTELELLPRPLSGRKSRRIQRTPECRRVVHALSQVRERITGEKMLESWTQAQLTRAQRLLREKSADEIIAQMVLAFADPFWAERIISIAKLEEHWGRFATKPAAPIMFPVRGANRVAPTSANDIAEFSPDELRARRAASA